ncbi:MAG: 3-phosphoshikimate 1-carboxyvinyltransferase [Haloglomus sp.]
MDAIIRESAVRGVARAPPSKSYTHRAILAAGYAEGALVRSPLDSADTRATARAVERYGGSTERLGEAGEPDDPEGVGFVETPLDADAGDLLVTGFGGRPGTPAQVIDCANSGTTMRLTTATGALADGLAVLTGDTSLRSRPQGPLLDAVEQLDGRAESTRGNGQAPLVVGGGVDGGFVEIPGDVSSQYVTALLMAGAVTDEGVHVDLTTALKSAPYVDITLEVLAEFGVEARALDDTGDPLDSAAAGTAALAVDGGQSYEPTDGEYRVPGDFSSISYLVAAGALAADPDDELVVQGAKESAQGDTAIVDVLEQMGADIDWDRDDQRITVRRSSLTGVEVGVANTPDLLPTIAAVGAAADGTTRITDCEHVRYKETDRVSAMATELEKLGASVEERPDELVVHGGESRLQGATVDGRADHRIVMALAVAGLVAAGETRIRGAEHVDVSFPGFFDVLYDLGADVAREE